MKTKKNKQTRKTNSGAETGVAQSCRWAPWFHITTKPRQLEFNWNGMKQKQKSLTKFG